MAVSCREPTETRRWWRSSTTAGSGSASQDSGWESVFVCWVGRVEDWWRTILEPLLLTCLHFLCCFRLTFHPNSYQLTSHRGFLFPFFSEPCQVEVRLLLAYNSNSRIPKSPWMEGSEVSLQVETSIEGTIPFSKSVKVYIMPKPARRWVTSSLHSLGLGGPFLGIRVSQKPRAPHLELAYTHKEKHDPERIFWYQTQEKLFCIKKQKHFKSVPLK